MTHPPKSDASMKWYPNLVEAAAEALQTTFESGRYADKVIEQTLKSNPRWGARDRAFIAETVYEVVRWYRLLCHWLGKEPRNNTEWHQLIGILYLHRGETLPPWAQFAALPASLPPAPNILALKESIPDWLHEIGSNELGPLWPKTLHALNSQAAVVLRTNTLRNSREQLQKLLLEEGIVTNFKGADALLVSQRKSLFTTKAFKAGLFELQDYSSQLVAPFLQAEPGMRVVDACAGGGGKTLHLAALMHNKGQIIAMDTEAWKLDELKHRAKRAGVGIVDARPITSTKVIKRLAGTADRVLLDAPCSGLGVLRRNPDAKWKLDAAFLDRVRNIQTEILQSYSRMVKPGGIMVYATCSILPSENERQVELFLASPAGQGFTLDARQSILPQDEGFDGFFMARLKKD